MGSARVGERAGDGAVIVSEAEKEEIKVRSRVLEGIKAPSPRPLDGGVLTRWGAHTPAKGPAMAPSSRSSLLGCCSLR